MAEIGRFALTYVDYGTPQESSTARFPIPVYDALGFDAQETLVDALATAVAGITLGVKTKDERGNVEDFPTAQPASKYAQRENKWLVRYHDSVTGNKSTLEIPTADLNELDPTKADRLKIDSGAGAAFVTAFNNVVLGPDGNAASVDEVLFVARNI